MYLEQEAKEKFIKAVLDIPPQFSTEQELHASELKISHRQSLLKENEQLLINLKNELLEKCGTVTECNYLSFMVFGTSSC